LTVSVTGEPAALGVRWSARSGADRYRIRAFGPDGSLLAELESPDTTIEMSVPTTAAFLDVTALDSLREPLAASPLVRLPPRPPR
jgi:hypothetical protein